MVVSVACSQMQAKLGREQCPLLLHALMSLSTVSAQKTYIIN